MKIAYVFATSGHTASYKLGKMILPQLEAGTHGVHVIGMFFFDDNNYILRAGDPIGERLSKIAREKGIMLMMCDQCALERGLATGEPGNCQPSGTVDGVLVGCFPDLYGALAANPPDQVITL
jgi:hypothetical protein